MLILICGKPRSGKTTLSKIFTCPVIHVDISQRKGCEDFIRKHPRERVCCEGFYPVAAFRKRLADFTEGFKLCVWVDTSLKIRTIRKKIVKDYDFDPPTLSEGWDKIVIIHDNDPKKVEVITRR